jgi:hypothetical protein
MHCGWLCPQHMGHQIQTQDLYCEEEAYRQHLRNGCSQRATVYGLVGLSCIFYRLVVYFHAYYRKYMGGRNTRSQSG